jgi:hypothetical protein
LLVMLTVSNGCLQFNNVGIYTKENFGWLSTDLCILDLSSSFSDLQSDPARGKLSNDARKIFLPKNDKLFLDWKGKIIEQTFWSPNKVTVTTASQFMPIFKHIIVLMLW